jgi:uncharacterized membrane protein
VSEAFLWIKWAHILGATLLFGTGLGTAFHMYATYRRGHVAAIAAATRNTVLADWLFIATSGVAQPVTGFLLVTLAGHDPLASWLVATYALYLVVAGCWLKVVGLQLDLRRMAADATTRSQPLSEEFHRAMRLWFILGWPAFFALIAVFALMVMKPVLW